MNISIERKVSVDVFRQRIPQVIVKSFDLGNLPYYFLYKFEQGYDFWLDGFYFNHYAVTPLNGNAILLELLVEFIRDIRSRTLQNEPVPCRLVSTPGARGNNSVMTAGRKLDYIRYNEPYVFSENLKARFTWAVPWGGGPLPVEIMMFGYLVPENTLEMWD